MTLPKILYALGMLMIAGPPLLFIGWLAWRRIKTDYLIWKANRVATKISKDVLNQILELPDGDKVLDLALTSDGWKKSQLPGGITKYTKGEAMLQVQREQQP